jgi:hypothetical protein
MFNIRRWYIYLVSAVSLQAVAWATIALLRNLLISNLNSPSAAIAFQIAVIIIGLPIFLVHWLWGQRLAERTVEEGGAALRRLYLYGTLAAFLGPFATNAFDLIGTLLQAESVLVRRSFNLTSGDAIIYHLVPLLVLGVLWLYHWRIVAYDAKRVPETGAAATIRRLYVLGFSVAGLTLTTLAIINLVRWIMLQFGDNIIQSSSLEVSLATEVTRLVIGTPMWLIFWSWAQRLFEGPSQEERESALRKFYLYTAVFVSALGTVINTAAILAGLLRRLLDLPPQGDIRTPLSIIIGLGLVWAYHAFVIQDDASRAEETPRQTSIRRLYLYLVAAIGLSALLIGLSGDISVIIRSLDAGFGDELREQLAWFTAAIIAGLPVWVLPWRQVQNQALEAGSTGADERRSVVRKIYLYFFLFLATMTVLSSAVFIVFKLLSWALGSDPPTLSELGQAIAFSLIAVGVWGYHGVILRSDHKLLDREQAQHLADLHLAVVDIGEGHFGTALVTALKQEMPDLALEPILLTQPDSVDSAEIKKDDEAITTQLAQAGLIVGPWLIAVPGETEGMVSPQISQMVVQSPARKLLVPTRVNGWEWAGVERWGTEALVEQTVKAIEQIAAGEAVKPGRPMGVGAIILIIIGVIILLSLLAGPLLSFFAF